ncbi:MAG TPA: hypothetical protein VNJ02_10225 [Vicinamibacterales bacterium]|nr:hypothetical protein [Vicinamibacterales bacterium]
MIEPDGYCREIEAYLCRKNDGHLIRITGPAFEQVTGWAHEGIPVKVACSGIDRYFERYYRKGPRRRPVRIEFCEADVLDAFDTWRRAVGVSHPAATATTAAGDHAVEQTHGRKRGSLSTHVERTMARLTTLRASSQQAAPFEAVLDRVTRDLDVLQLEATRARGDARDALLERLAGLDRALMDHVMESIDHGVRADAQRDAKDTLSPFRGRMTADAYRQAEQAAVEKHVRDHFGLPVIAFDRS